MKNSTPFFSVVMPVYNKEKHVIRALESIKAQRFTDYEVIVVCDPSTDNSSDLVKAYQGLDLKIFYREQPGPGGYAARNKGISESKGQWIAFLDADDEWTEIHLEKTYKAIIAFPEVNMVGASWILQKGENEGLDKFSRKHQTVDQPTMLSLDNYLENSNHGKRPIHTSVASIKKNALDKNLPPFFIHPEVKRGGDLYLWLRMMCQYKKMVWSPHIGARYSLDADNMVTKMAPSKATLMSRESFAKLSEELSSNEKKRLVRYFNRWIRNDWRSNTHRGCENFSLLKTLYWKEDFVYAFIAFMTSVIPDFLRRLNK